MRVCVYIYDSTGMSAEAGSSVLYEKVDAMVSLKLAVNTQDARCTGWPPLLLCLMILSHILGEVVRVKGFRLSERAQLRKDLCNAHPSPPFPWSPTL